VTIGKKRCDLSDNLTLHDTPGFLVYDKIAEEGTFLILQQYFCGNILGNLRVKKSKRNMTMTGKAFFSP